MSGNLARPQVASTDNRMDGLVGDIANVLTKTDYNSSLDALVKSVAPNCTQFILECQIGSSTKLTGEECCQTIFNPKPFLTEYGKKNML